MIKMRMGATDLLIKTLKVTTWSSSHARHKLPCPAMNSGASILSSNDFRLDRQCSWWAVPTAAWADDFGAAARLSIFPERANHVTARKVPR